MKPLIYINGASALSVQDTLYGCNPNAFVRYRSGFVPALDPDFKEHIPIMAARRMSRIIKRAVTVSQLALRQAEVVLPDAIIFGTGLGCMEDTEKFLNAVLDQEEELLQPAFFIQSTHNTIAAQVAMRLECRGYNNTFVQRRLSFESALLDAYMLFQEGRVQSVLTGGHDELTPSYYRLLDKAGYYTHGFAGEGSTSFVLSNRPCAGSYAILQGLEMRYFPHHNVAFTDVALPFLQKLEVSPEELGAIFTADYEVISCSVTFSDIPQFPCKEWCGEFFTASAFALWQAAHYLRSGYLSKPYILLHNHAQNKHHSLILLKHINS